MKLFLLSAMVSRNTGHQTTFSHMQGYRTCESEDEAKGDFMTAVWKEKPGYAIEQMLVMEVPLDVLKSVTA
jgi:hypothetical protein